MVRKRNNHQQKLQKYHLYNKPSLQKKLTHKAKKQNKTLALVKKNLFYFVFVLPFIKYLKFTIKNN